MTRDSQSRTPLRPAESPPRAAIIMRAKNSDWVIGEALAALYSQSFTDFELLVVDSGSSDRTLELVGQYPHRLIEIDPADYFPGKVLNRAIAETQSDIIVFQNSDAVPLTADTLAHLMAAFNDPGVDAALARQLPRPEAHTWVKYEYAASFPDGAETPPWITLSLPLAAMRRRAWEAHPFYTDAWGSEDTEWGTWAKRTGRRIRYVPQALVMHSHNYTLKQLYGRRFIEGEADGFIYGRRANLLAACARAVLSTARDIGDCLRERDFVDMAKAPARRTVYHWAYYQGLRHSGQRQRQRDRDASTGQRIALSHHKSNR